MYLLGLGIALLLMKHLEIDPVATWPWWVVLAPFALAAVWWVWADTTGYTKRKAMERMDQKKRDRLEKQRENLGIKTGKRR
ncbi:MAG: TIGR04438 family Trp-rich protein [Hydrogenophaga sp.]|uniref:TIGR04438 family Trp-rich protein n=1 Tax=Hydrogenophaga sp. TaxID=1904254 RepID=UPI001D5A28DD|nr:TIGR04438 family Trp-rich protein [Hydrogenophaga sp.]MBX3610293.1 TIGR04438 family Trp-rich protein [Hydrogenophaga sp.]